MLDKHLFDSDDEEEYVPEEGEDDEDEDAEVGHGEDSSEGDNDEDEFDDECYESCGESEDSEGETVQPPTLGTVNEELNFGIVDATPSPSIVSPTPVPIPITLVPSLVLSPSIPTPILSTSVAPPSPTPIVLNNDNTNGVIESLQEFEIGVLSEQPTIGGDIEDVISKRTRAHHSLVDVELAELESKYHRQKIEGNKSLIFSSEYLQTSPCGSPIDFDIDDWAMGPYRAEEYQTFLASLQTDDVGKQT